MTKHNTATRQEWLAERVELLKAEKELTRRSDELARRRQALPWVRIDKPYRFETDEGSASLKDLFRGRSQLIVYHFMFGPDFAAGCPSCSAIADGFNGVFVHLANHDVTLTAVSRAPLAKLQAYKRRLGWTFPWASSFGSDFNDDFSVHATEEQQRTGSSEYNYRPERADAGGCAGAEGRCAVRGEMRHRRTDVHARKTGREHVRAGGRRRVSHVFGLRPRTGRLVGHVSVARSRAERSQRKRRLVAPPRRVPQQLSKGATVAMEASRRMASQAMPLSGHSSARRRCWLFRARPSRFSGVPPCRQRTGCRCPAAGRCRWRGCGCRARHGPAPRRRFWPCGS